jgi:type I restriction enzyme M protein
MPSFDKKSLSERDICTKYITPAITDAGWDIHAQIREEYFFTDGRVHVLGKSTKRGPAKMADYLLFHMPHYPLAIVEANFPKMYQTRETADLFLVLIMHLLKPGGRGAIVLPDGTLFGEGVKTRIKEKLLDECNLHTIVRLPNGVFSPYTGIKTNLLFFTKGHPTKHIWYYEHTYPAGYKSYSKTKPIRIEEFATEKKWWGKSDDKGGFKGRKSNEFAWKVSVGEIKANGFNLDIKNPNNADTGPGDPDDLLKEPQKIAIEENETLNELKQELAGTLSAEESNRE